MNMECTKELGDELADFESCMGVVLIRYLDWGLVDGSRKVH